MWRTIKENKERCQNRKTRWDKIKEVDRDWEVLGKFPLGILMHILNCWFRHSSRKWQNLYSRFLCTDEKTMVYSSIRRRFSKMASQFIKICSPKVSACHASGLRPTFSAICWPLCHRRVKERVYGDTERCSERRWRREILKKNWRGGQSKRDWAAMSVFLCLKYLMSAPALLKYWLFSHIARGDRWEWRLFPRSNEKQKAVSIKLSLLPLIYLFFVFFFDLHD